MSNKTILMIVIGILVIGTAVWIGTRSVSGYFSTDTTGLPVAQKTKVVTLRDGDIYDLIAGYVVHTIDGTDYRMLAYNGMIPGPLITVPEDAEVTIRFTNNTDINTLLHSHGIRMDNAFDGSQTVQSEMRPGETFEYKLKFDDPGVYWYHPHVREDYQQELGLYGNFLVTPNDSTYWNPVNREVALFVDDILIEDGRIAPFRKSNVTHTLMGRFGNTMLVNGQTDHVIQAMQGDVVRMYITNSANTRVFNLSIPGVKMKLVGGDNGVVRNEQWVDSIILGPSERVIVEAYFPTKSIYTLTHTTPTQTYDMATISVSDDAPTGNYVSVFNALRANVFPMSSDAFQLMLNRPPDKDLRLGVELSHELNDQMSHGESNTMGHGSMMSGAGMMSGGDGIEWENPGDGMNMMSNTTMTKWIMSDAGSGESNMDIDDWRFRVGDQVKIRITNDAMSMHPMQHPIHFHGQRFVVLATNGIPNNNPVWKDTVLVPTGATVDIMVEMSNPGTWMAHCHIPEHMESGMMMQYQVVL